MKLRPYQTDLVTEVHKYLAKVKRAVVVAGTGAGKTVVAVQILEDFFEQGEVTLFLVDRDNLVSQTVSKLQAFGLKYGVIKAGYPETPTAKIQIASLQTLEKREWWKSLLVTRLIFDECHETRFRKISAHICDEIFPDALELGLTATPYRAKKKEHLGDIYVKGIYAPVPGELIKAGFLVPNVYYSIGEYKGRQRTSSDGDFVRQDLSVACDSDEVIEGAIDKWFEKAYGKRTICFCVDVAHAEHVTKKFLERGVRAACITAKTTTDQRNCLYGGLRELDLTVLVSVDTLTKGFDEPSVEVNLMLRPTKSRALFEQMLGRTMRICPQTGKVVALVLDQVGNVQRFASKHGFVEDYKSYRLSRTGDEEPEENPVPLKKCPECGNLDYGFVKKCTQCGAEYISAPKEAPKFIEMTRIFKSANEETEFNIFQNNLREAYRMGYKPDWATQKYKVKHHGYPRFDWALGAIHGDKPESEDYEKHLEYLFKCAVKDGVKDKASSLKWIRANLTREFGERWHLVLPETESYKGLESRIDEMLPQMVIKKVDTNCSEQVDYGEICATIKGSFSKALFTQQTVLKTVDGKTLVVRCKAPKLLKQMASNIGDLKDAIAEVVGVGFDVKVVI